MVLWKFSFLMQYHKECQRSYEMIVIERIENNQCTKEIHIENYTIERISTDHLLKSNNDGSF